MVDSMRRGGGYRGQPESNNGGDPFLDWIQGIIALGGNYTLTEDDMAKLANYWSMQSAYQQDRQFDLQGRAYDVQEDELAYRMDYNQFLRDELGYKGDQLEFAKKQFEFQSGPEFEFYKQERTMQHDAEMKGYESQMQQSADDVLRSSNYLQQQRYATEAAEMQRDMARFQSAQAMGLADPVTGQRQGGSPRVLQRFGGY